ncbi:MAG TPA: hypothetical protein VGN34_05800 [Ktedonobacteraceae bacterium]
MKNIYREVNGEIIIGKSLPALVVNSNGLYVLDDIEVYKDGKIICGSIKNYLWMERGETSLDDFARAVAQGKLVTTVPEGVHVYRFGVAAFMVANVYSQLEKKEDYLLAVHDILHELNGELTSLDHCRAAFFQFLDEPSQENHEQLRQAYEAIPSSRKMSVLDDIDDADTAITAILVRDVPAIDKEWLEELRDRYACLR